MKVKTGLVIQIQKRGKEIKLLQKSKVIIEIKSKNKNRIKQQELFKNNIETIYKASSEFVEVKKCFCFISIF